MHNKAPLMILAVVALIGFFAMLYNYVTPVPTQMVIVGVGQPGADTIQVPNLEINEYIFNEMEAITDTQLAGLRGGYVIGDTKSNYYQYIQTGGATAGFNGGRIEFVKDERDQLNDYLVFRDYIFKYTLDFDGLASEVQGNELVDLDNKDILMLGSQFTIMDTYVNGNAIELSLFGGFGQVVLKDSDFTDNNYQAFGAKINGQNIDADVRIKAITSGNLVTLYNIEYRLAANGPTGGDVFIPPERCAQDFIQYPQGMIASNFDICYAGLGAAASTGYPTQDITGEQVKFIPRPATGYWLSFINNDNSYYKFPFYDVTGGAHYGDKNGRITHFQEAPAPGAPNIALNDYFVVMNRLDINGVTNVLQYDQLDTTNNKIFFKDLGGKDKATTFDGTGRGTLNIGRGEYNFQVNLVTQMLAIDQTGDGNINGGTAQVIVKGGNRIQATPGFTVNIITPRRLRETANVDEVTQINLVGNDIQIPSPQGPVFNLEGVGGSVYQAMTQWGILFTYDMENTPSKLELTIPGTGGGGRSIVPSKGGALSGVLFTLDRQGLQMAGATPSTPAPSMPVCGNGEIDPGEECDPPGIFCKGVQAGKSILGICQANCKCKWYKEPVCGDMITEAPEECERDADCGQGFRCEQCKCVQVQPVCGNGIVELGEQCEFDSQCAEGLYCGNCMCRMIPIQEVPEPTGGFFNNIWLWIKRIFGAK